MYTRSNIFPCALRSKLCYFAFPFPYSHNRVRQPSDVTSTTMFPHPSAK
jgi:hypothetical protein